MDFGKERRKKGNLIVKTWERCKSLGRGGKRASRSVGGLTTKSRSLPSLHLPYYPSVRDDDDDDKRNSIITTACSRKRRVAPEGCFSVYVGAEKQRFVIKTEYANHPLFKILLEEAESEYGYNPEGPLVLPCNVDIFCKVLVAIDSNDDDTIHRPQGCGFSKNYRLLSPSRMVALNQF